MHWLPLLPRNAVGAIGGPPGLETIKFSAESAGARRELFVDSGLGILVVTLLGANKNLP
jgi:hypothetical protein